MKRYSNDPYWTRYASTCTKCGCVIKRDQEIFYYPATKSVHCTPCGVVASADFAACAQDEETYNYGR